MVLEAGQGPRITSFELALEEDVADHAPLAGNGVVGEKADPGKLRPRAVAVEAAEELIAAAYGQECCSGLHGFDERGALGGEVGGDERLLAVLAAADVVEVVLAGPDGLAETDRPVVQLDAAPRAPALEDGDVAAVRVDVQVLGIEVRDDELHATASSQYGRTRPCSEAIWRRASMAVYVGRTTSSPPGRVPSTPYASASARSGRSAIFAGSSPPYLKRKASSWAREPLTTSSWRGPTSGSKSTSQIHETSRPSAIASFSATSRRTGAPRVHERADDLVRTRRVLDEEEQDGAVARSDALEAPEGRTEPRQPGLDVVQAGAEDEGERGRSEGVVDVVEPGEGERHCVASLPG